MSEELCKAQEVLYAIIAEAEPTLHIVAHCFEDGRPIIHIASVRNKINDSAMVIAFIVADREITDQLCENISAMAESYCDDKYGRGFTIRKEKR
jgi:hypothetical protein